ncbi:MAG: hypothetical protein ACQEWV_24100 [Bacillota bacterium]
MKAKITYEFLLPEKEMEEYKTEIDRIKSDDINDYWNEIQHSFLRKYVHKIYVGQLEYKNSVDAESMKKFAFQFLTAIRDVERDLYSGSNALLKEIIDFFMDYEAMQ